MPFLVVAFAVLYPWPGDTDRLFAWHIRPTMTAMVLGSAYLGGAWFFVHAALRWVASGAARCRVLHPCTPQPCEGPSGRALR